MRTLLTRPHPRMPAHAVSQGAAYGPAGLSDALASLRHGSAMPDFRSALSKDNYDWRNWRPRPALLAATTSISLL